MGVGNLARRENLLHIRHTHRNNDDFRGVTTKSLFLRRDGRQPCAEVLLRKSLLSRFSAVLTLDN